MYWEKLLLNNKEFVFLINWEILMKKFVNSYSENSWKHVVSSILDHWSKCPRKICPVCQPIKMAIQGQEGSGIPDYLNLSAYAQTNNAQASLANKIELVKW